MRLAVYSFVTGLLVSILEAVCTGQVYLPTIAYVLKRTHLWVEALGYLLLYNIMFIAPLFVVFFAYLYLRELERVSPKLLASIAVTVLGVVLVSI
jgi:cytochrome c biogenesis protein CcdA